eukprot:CAMPEP_0174712832 /NCGR_PEP_ID=MMETSP1094-20130205/13703_1 /TAXON_ID=156173 /ORGANISM="Chrysochromulina brevifilum, Strain UTEX LB 985" /LENGTH=51 /DNA_ID=CAMNT_0015911939 /DNA_START=63 /DNA_END=215 /DNA_ORIENTATION=+
MNTGYRSLALAAQNGHLPCLQLLLQEGGDIGAAANEGFTALMLAAQNGHER